MRKAALAFLLLAPAALAAAAEREVFEKAYSLDGVSRISVQNVNGRIEASAWDRPYLRVRAVKTGVGHTAEELRLTEIRVRKVGDQILVETVNPRRHHLFGFLDFGGRGLRVDYDVHIPTGVPARLETCNGKVVATGLGGALTCDAVNGSIEVADGIGPVRATTVNGSLRIDFRGPLKQSRLETVNGSVEVAFPRSSSVRYELETVHGRIEGDFDLAVEGKHGPRESHGSYNGGAETLKCETINGSIRLKTK